MKIAIFSDVHGNLEALDKFLAAESNSDLIISLGDVVNYGPFSNECAIRLHELKHDKILLRGNHDQAFLDGKYPGTHPTAQAFFNHCYPKFNEHKLVKYYNYDYKKYNFHFTHTIGDKYIYHDSDIDLNYNTAIGHSHQQFIKLLPNGKILINPGSLGQNRQDLSKGEYIIYYPKDKTFLSKSIHLNPERLLQDMLLDRFPKECLSYIKNKI